VVSQYGLLVQLPPPGFNLTPLYGKPKRIAADVFCKRKVFLESANGSAASMRAESGVFDPTLLTDAAGISLPREELYLFQKSHDFPMVSPFWMVGSVS
jgi:hypothetical protein